MLTTQQIKDEFEKKFGNPPAISGSITDSDECCNCGEDLSLELYDAFSVGYNMAIDDSKSFLLHLSAQYEKLIGEVIPKNRKLLGSVEKNDIWRTGYNECLSHIRTSLQERGINLK